jgi:hypothetical protein
VQPEGSVLVLVDLRNTVTSPEVVSMMKVSAARTKGHEAEERGGDAAFERAFAEQSGGDALENPRPEFGPCF